MSDPDTTAAPASSAATLEALAADVTERPCVLGRGSRQGHRPSAQADFGVYTEDLRRVVREARTLLVGRSAELVHALALALLSRRVTECRQAAYELIAGHRAAREALTEALLERLGEGMNNRACVDGFCCALVGRAWREGRISDAAIRRWVGSDDRCWRRAALVATVQLNTPARGGKGASARTLEICALLAADREPTIQKALSWALRSLSPWDPSGVEAFLSEHDQAIAGFVRREVQSKLTKWTKR